MKKITKTLVAILLIAVLSMTNIVVFAEDGVINPRLSHMNSEEFSFFAYENIGYIDVAYSGNDSFVRADLNVKVQKRFLLVFWNDVYEFNAASTVKNGRFNHEFDITDGSGMYRAKFSMVVTGNDGTKDTITETIECEHN